MDKLQRAKDRFFSDCDLVVQAPGSFFLTGEHSVEVGQPGLLLVTDFWTKVGVRFRPGTDFTFKVNEVNPSAPLHKPRKLDPNRDYFKPDEADPYLIESLKDLTVGLKKWQAKNPGVEAFDTLVWSDIPFAVGFNAGSAMSVCLGMIMYYQEQIVAGKSMKPTELNETVRRFFGLDYEGLMNNAAFRRIFELSRFCDDLLLSRYKSGASTFASLVRTSESRRTDARGELILYFTEWRGVHSDFPLERTGPIDYTKDMENLAKLQFYGTRIKMPGWLRKTYGISLVYSGERASYEAVWEKVLKRYTLKKSSLAEKLDDMFPERFEPPHANLPQPLRYIMRNPADEGTLDGEPAERWPRLFPYSNLGLIAWCMLEAILSSDPASDSRFKELIIDNNRMLKAYGVLRGHLREFKRILRYVILTPELREKSWCKVTGTGDGGNVIIFAEGKPLKQINNLVLNYLPKAQKKAREASPGAEEDTPIGPQLHCTSVRNNRYTPTDKPPVVKPVKPKPDPRRVTLARRREEIREGPHNNLRLRLSKQQDGSIIASIRGIQNPPRVTLHITDERYLGFLEALATATRIRKDFYVSRWNIYRICGEHTGSKSKADKYGKDVSQKSKWRSRFGDPSAPPPVEDEELMKRANDQAQKVFGAVKKKIQRYFEDAGIRNSQAANFFINRSAPYTKGEDPLAVKKGYRFNKDRVELRSFDKGITDALDNPVIHGLDEDQIDWLRLGTGRSGRKRKSREGSDRDTG